ncbi:hypothetical protein CF326_g8735 [Tilletia indica]|uniref:Uncharacterized protein n=1 Tax=Tilletia indica TaxID=43049 RepID=A0A177SZN3_9BASI|nr:hypothetical protein CF326_g8735 [Tilletia indica]KAE8237353.1 hypothetical protein A4X13_0g8822 [Tilletia indica]
MPLFRLSHWAPGHGLAARPDAWRYFNGFNPDFAWHLFTPSKQILAPLPLNERWSQPNSHLAVTDIGPLETRLQFSKWLMDANQNKGQPAETLKDVHAPDYILFAIDRMYEKIVVSGPQEDSFHPNGINVLQTEDVALAEIWKMMRSRFAGLAPQPLVYAWGQSRDLWPRWAASCFYAHQTTRLIFSSVSRLSESDGPTEGTGQSAFVKHMLPIPRRLDDL